MSKILEDEVKNAVLHYSNLLSYLGDLGESKILFEKSINYHKVIADSLVFTENSGLIGIEIKTKSDNLKRLEHQLDSYTLACNYTFVFCHDSHLNQVTELLDKNHYDYVGIISYDEFNGKVIAGLVREAKISPRFSLKVMASLLWKKELYSVLQMWFGHQDTILANTYKSDNVPYTRSGSVGNLRHNVSYRKLLSIYQHTFSTKQGTKIICEMYIKNGYNPKKQLQQYHFNNEFNGDISFKTPYKYK